MDNGNPTVVDKSEILKPSVVPAPGKPQRKNKAARQETEKDVNVDLNPLTYGPGSDHGHFDTEANKVNPAAIIVRIHLGTCELGLAQ